MADIPVYEYDESHGFQQSAAGDTLDNSRGTELIVYNASGGNTTVTLTAVGRCSHGFASPQHDKVVVCPTGVVTFIRDIEHSIYGTSVDVSYSDTVGVGVAGKRLAPL